MDQRHDAHRRSRPSALGLARLARALGAEEEIRVLRRLGGGIASATHALDVPGVGRVVLKRYREADTTPAQEATALAFAFEARLPVPEPLAVDPEGSWFGTPALAMRHVAGRPDVAPIDVEGYVAEVVDVAARMHAAPIAKIDSALRRPHQVDTWRQPDEVPAAHLPRSMARRMVGVIADTFPTAPRGSGVFNHADFHPGNLVWRRRRLAAVVDWSAGKVGFRWWDVAYFRNELGVLVDADAADEFLRQYEIVVGERSTHQAVWDLICLYNAHNWAHQWLLGYHEQGRRDLTIQEVQRRLRVLATRALAAAGEPVARRATSPTSTRRARAGIGDPAVRIAPLETDRLRLRALEDGDIDAVFAILGDEVTTANVSWRQPDRRSTAAWVQRRVAQEHEFGLSMWAVERKDTSELVGLCGFFPADESSAELGYVVRSDHWGNGYATEAVTAALDAATSRGFAVWATIRSTNTVSLAVARKVGLVQQNETIDDERGRLLVLRASPHRRH